MAGDTQGLSASVRATVSELASQLASKDYAVRTTASKSLVAIGRPAVAALCEMLSNRDDHVRWEAAKALGTIADPAAASALGDTIEDHNVDVRWAVAEALACLGIDGILVLLPALEQKPTSETLRRGTHHVAHSLVRAAWAAPLRQVIAAIDGPNPNIEIPVACRAAINELRKR